MVFESKNVTMRSNNNKGSKKLSRQKRNINVAKENKSWPHFQDEDYIVFCFREDGAFDVVKDCKPEELDERFDSFNKSPRPVNRKLKYGEIVETVTNSSHVNGSNTHGSDSCLKNGEGINHIEEGMEAQSSHLNIRKSPSFASTRSSKCKEMKNHGTLSVESNDSNHSDGSTGSFSFPVLHWELMGSPVQMPKSEGLYIRKHKVSCASFQCCRF